MSEQKKSRNARNGAHTVKKMFSKSVIGHILGNNQSLITITAVPNQIGKSWVAQVSDAPSFLGKLLRVRPGQFGEFLDGDPTAVLEAALVDDIGGSLAAFGDDVVRAEVVCGRF